jgi:hypothetical protein
VVTMIYVIFEQQNEDPISYHSSREGAEKRIKLLESQRLVEILETGRLRDYEYWIEECVLEN